MQKILVTGGAGFIGSHTIDLLIDNGYQVVIVDSLITGKKENINKKAKFYKEDIRSENLRKIFEKEKPDFVIHLAAQTNARKSIKNPVYDEDVNIRGSLNLLECCREFKVKKIVYASSAAIYGDPKKLPVSENSAISPINFYGVSKYVVEKYLFNYSHLYGIDYIVLRYSNVYGPRQDPFGEGGVIAIFSEKVSKNKPIVIFGDGNQTRDFVFVKDVANANLLATTKKTKNKIFNISTNTETSINELFGLMKEISGSKSKAIYEEAREGDIVKSRLSNEIAKKELGFSTKIELEEGLRKTISYFR